MTTMSSDAKKTLADAGAREVARLAEVSLSTVSRVFRDSPSVHPETAERVRAAARSVGYQPSNSARSLRTGVSSTVGYFLRTPTGLMGEFHARTFAAIEQRLADDGLQTLVTSMPAGVAVLGHASAMLAQESLCALVVQADELHPADVADLASLPRPVLMLNYAEPLPPAASNLLAVGFDNRAGVVQAVRHLAALGHRRIAFIGGTPATNDALQREEGYRMAMQSLELALEDRWVRPGHFGDTAGGFLSGSSQMDHLLAERSCLPSAVVAASDEIAIGAMDSVRRCGLVVPADISVVGYDNHSWSAYTHPRLTTVHHDGWQMGEAATELLLAAIKLGPPRTRQMVLPTQLIVRDSTARPA